MTAHPVHQSHSPWRLCLLKCLLQKCKKKKKQPQVTCFSLHLTLYQIHCLWLHNACGYKIFTASHSPSVTMSMTTRSSFCLILHEIHCCSKITAFHSLPDTMPLVTRSSPLHQLPRASSSQVYGDLTRISEQSHRQFYFHIIIESYKTTHNIIEVVIKKKDDECFWLRNKYTRNHCTVQKNQYEQQWKINPS